MDFLHYITQINGLIGAIISETYIRHILRMNILTTIQDPPQTQNDLSFFFRIVLPITPNSESDEGTGSSSTAVLCNNDSTTTPPTTVKKEEDEDYRATTTFRTDAEDAFEALIRGSSRANSSRTAIIKSEAKTEDYSG